MIFPSPGISTQQKDPPRRCGIIETAAALGLLLLCGVASSQTKTASSSLAGAKPNIVFILVDDLRADALGCTGHPFSKTPNIDRIAREGALFQNAFITTPLCSPGRGGFLTGQYAHTHKVLWNSAPSELSRELDTFPRRLQAAGYDSAYVGKWHMGGDPNPRPGFDRWIALPGQGKYVNPELNFDGVTTTVQGYVTDILTSHAVEFIRGKHENPFVLYLGHKAVHGPFTPAERHKDLYANEPLKFTPAAELGTEEKPALDGRNERKHREKFEENRTRTMLNQLRCIASIDEGVGEIFKALEETKQLNNTMIVFTSDNGFFWGEFGFMDKRTAHDPSIRIPLLIRVPGAPPVDARARARISDFVLNVDIAPTFLELAGLPVPRTMHGTSLMPLLTGRRPGTRKEILTEYFLEPEFPSTPSWKSIRTDQWKYIHYPTVANADELYDLKADPHEMKNLATEKEQADRVAELKKRMLKLEAETGPYNVTLPDATTTTGAVRAGEIPAGKARAQSRRARPAGAAKAN